VSSAKAVAAIAPSPQLTSLSSYVIVIIVVEAVWYCRGVGYEEMPQHDVHTAVGWELGVLWCVLQHCIVEVSLTGQRRRRRARCNRPNNQHEVESGKRGEGHDKGGGALRWLQGI
jgi:hypothetical protein